jgi:hypothetical protein
MIWRMALPAPAGVAPFTATAQQTEIAQGHNQRDLLIA